MGVSDDVIAELYLVLIGVIIIVIGIAIIVLTSSNLSGVLKEIFDSVSRTILRS